MSLLRIETRDNQTQFLLGEEIVGTVSWLLAPLPDSLELRLFWYTRGKGTEDVEVVDAIRFRDLRPEETREFRLRVPDGPYSFSGKLISLIWALELVAQPSEDAVRLDITVSPTGREILLYKESRAGGIS
jgi:hypothetical protein